MTQQIKAAWILFSCGVVSFFASYFAPVEGAWIFGPFHVFFFVSLIIACIVLVKEGTGNALTLIIACILCVSCGDIAFSHKANEVLKESLNKIDTSFDFGKQPNYKNP